MAIFLQSGYTLPSGDKPLTHARIAHSGNWDGDATASAIGTASGYFVDAPLNSLTYEHWKPDAFPNEWRHVGGAYFDADYCCIASHTLGSSATDVTLEYFNGSSWVEIMSISPTDDSPIMMIFEEERAGQWRLNVDSTDPSPVMPQVGVVRFGLALQMPRPIYAGHTPAHFSRNTTMRSNKSETGEFLGRSILRTDLKAAFSWQYVASDWVRSNWDTAQKAFETEPFFVAWRPDAFGDVAYVLSDGPASATNQGGLDLMTIGISGRALAYD